MLTELKYLKNPFLIGFDDIFNILDNIDNNPTYPPYNIIKTGDNNWHIEIAVAGYTENDINVTYENGKLIVESESLNKKDKEEQKIYLYKGISGKKFKLVWRLAEYVEVKDVVLKNGILTINLERNIPEYLRPKQIKIQKIEN